jgi:hypothetical protein
LRQFVAYRFQWWLFIQFITFYHLVGFGFGQNKRIAPLSFLHGCRKRRLKD